jgi:hypothetical protein
VPLFIGERRREISHFIILFLSVERFLPLSIRSQVVKLSVCPLPSSLRFSCSFDFVRYRGHRKDPENGCLSPSKPPNFPNFRYFPSKRYCSGSHGSLMEARSGASESDACRAPFTYPFRSPLDCPVLEKCGWRSGDFLCKPGSGRTYSFAACSFALSSFAFSLSFRYRKPYALL